MWLACGAVFLSAGCAPGLGTELSVERIPEAQEIAPGSDYLFKVRVEKLRDQRKNRAAAEVGGRELEPLGDPGMSVKSALEQRLKSQGGRVSLFEGPILGGEIRDWRVRVIPAFPLSRADARADVTLELYDGAGRVVYRGNYSGTFQAENPVFSSRDIEDVLGGAMAEALNQALDDDGLMSKLHAAGKI